MGTSTSYDGPGQGTPLLPPWAPPPPKRPPVPRRTGDWGKAKRDLGRYVTTGATHDLANAARSYVRASGGGRGAGISAIGGKAAVAAFGNFAAGVATKGIEQTLTDLGLAAVVGESVDVVFAAIADRIAPDGAFVEEAIARKAVLDALAYLYDEYVTAEADVRELSSLDRAKVEEAIRQCICSYIYERWLHELGIVIERKNVPESKVLKLELNIREFIKSAVQCDLGAFDILYVDFTKGVGKNLIDKIFEQAYSALESL